MFVWLNENKVLYELNWFTKYDNLRSIFGIFVNQMHGLYLILNLHCDERDLCSAV